MDNKKKSLNPAMIIIATILGVATFKEFDFEKLHFKKLGLGLIYLLTFLGSLFLIFNGRKRKPNGE